MYFLRANRGVTLVDSDVAIWDDTRPEITLDSLVPIVARELPGWLSADNSFNSRPSINFGGEPPFLRSGSRI